MYSLCKKLISFFTRNHRLPIETGRWQNIPTNERLCPTCRDIGDEYHYLLKCPIFNEDRRKYIHSSVYTRPNMIKLINLLSSENLNTLKNLGIFCDKIMKQFSVNYRIT